MTEGGKFRLHGGAACDDHDVVAAFELRLQRAEKLAQTAARPVAYNGVPEFGADRQTQTVTVEPIRAAVDRKVAVRRVCAAVIQPPKDGVFFDRLCHRLPPENKGANRLLRSPSSYR